MSAERDKAIYEAAKLHALRRGIDLTEWPNPQALVPDEFRWMREAIDAYEEQMTASEAPTPGRINACLEH